MGNFDAQRNQTTPINAETVTFKALGNHQLFAPYFITHNMLGPIKRRLITQRMPKFNIA
jgi:hypothetical protein